MNKLLTCLFAASMALTAAADDGRLLAFPGAEGFGRYSTGGRGGVVYHVTNLEDSGTGSFRDAVSGEHRIIVFDVCGTIRLKSALVIKGNNTILGQTAPGEGVQVYGNRISFSGANNLIVRHMRFRMGVNGDSGKDCCGIANGENMIFDHLSVLWGQDENFSVNWDSKNIKPRNITIQNSIIGQGLQTHSCGGLIQTDGGVTLFRNLYIENKTRNPKVKGLNQYVNNVVYNWGNGGCYIMGETEGASWAHIENNYFMRGPWNSATEPFIRGSEAFHFFASGNMYDSNKNGVVDGVLLTTDEQRGWLRGKTVMLGGVETKQDWASTPVESLEALNNTVIHEVIHKQVGNGSTVPIMDEIASEQDVAIDQPIPVIESMMSAEDALAWIIDNVGPVLPARDEVDQYLIDELMSFGKEGTKNGISGESQLPHKGTGTLSGGVKPLDTDGDGIPDEWEIANGLNPNDWSDAPLLAANGYSNIENYANSIVAAYPYIKKPVKLAATAQAKTSITLTWNLNGNTDCGFIIETSADGGKTFTEAARAEAGTTTFEVTGLQPLTDYVLRIRAYNADGIYSDYSNEVTADTTGDPAAPTVCVNPTPANGAKQGIAGGVTLSWENTTKAHFGAVTYDVYLAENGAELAKVQENISAKTYKPAELEANKVYNWRVDARNDIGTTTGDVWSFSTTEEGVIFYTDFYTQPAEWAEKYGSITANTNINNTTANFSVVIGGMTIGCGEEAVRIVAMNGANNSDDMTKDYGPATAEDAGASDRCIQFVTTKAGGYVKTPVVDGPCKVTVYAGNPETSSKTIKLYTVVNGEETLATEMALGAKKRVFKFTYTYANSGNVAFKIDANGKKVNINDIIVERYVPQTGEMPIELTSGSLVNDNLSYADGTLTLAFNQDIVYNGGAVLKGKTQWETVKPSATGDKLNIAYEGLNFDTEYTVSFPQGSVTSVDGSRSFIADLTIRTCGQARLKADGETHYGKAAAELPLSFGPFTAVAPFTTEGGLVQEKQNDYPHWVQASGSVSEDVAVLTSTSDKLMCYFAPQSKEIGLMIDYVGTGNPRLRIQESQNCDVTPGWRTIRVLEKQNFPFHEQLPLHSDSHFVKVSALSIGGEIHVKAMHLSDAEGNFLPDYEVASVGETAAPAVVVAVNGENVTVLGLNAGDVVEVYDLTGAKLVSTEESGFTLGHGLYIITVNGRNAVKVRI